MTKEKFLLEYDLLVNRNERAARNMEECVLHIHAQMDDLMGAISGVNELSKGFATLLNQTSVKLTEQGIHEMIADFEAARERGKKFSPGVPKEVLKKVG